MTKRYLNRLISHLTVLRASLAGLLVAVLPACEGGSTPTASAVASEGKPIYGNVSYRENVAVPEGAELGIQLLDISRADAPATVLGALNLPVSGSPPFSFELSYDPAQIESRHRYSLRATIRRDGELLFSSTEFIDPFGEPPLAIQLTQIQPAPKPGFPLAGRGWRFTTIDGNEVPATVNGQVVSLLFDATEPRLSGFAGCNRYTGALSHGPNNALTFGAVAGTRRACVQGAELETSVYRLFSQVRSYRLAGKELQLLAGDTVLATLEPMVDL